MVINGHRLLELAPIKDMESSKIQRHGVSFGLTEAGYDIRIKQDVHFRKVTSGFNSHMRMGVRVSGGGAPEDFRWSRFCLASAIEEFQMPPSIVAKVHDKSTWARRGLSVFNTVIESGWKGFLTLELVYHGEQELVIPAGSGIAQVLFWDLASEASYNGKYQNQADRPVPAIYQD